MVIRDSKKNKAAWLSEAGEYQKALLVTSFEMRTLSILLALLSASILKNILMLPIPPQIMYAFWAWLATTLVYLYAFKAMRSRRNRTLDRMHFSYYFAGITYSTAIVYYLGGAEWIAFVIYIFDLVYANVLLKRKKAAIVTLFVYLCYFGLIGLEYAGLLPHNCIISPQEALFDNPKYVIATSVIIVGVTYFILAYSTGLFSKMKEDRESVLIESKNRFAVKSRQLEMSTATLIRQIEENRYLKTAAAEYIAKKEMELDLAKQDMEGQIEKLRKTQKSMYFMIEDLNRMSRELKGSKDHLEEKVRERTDELLAISSKLHRSERLAFLGKLAGSITHELRNPLAVLKNAAYFLDGKLKDHKDEKVLKYIEIIEKEIGIIDSIIEDIMGFARTKVPDFKEQDVENIVEEAISTLSVPDLIEVRKEFEPIPDILVDAKQLTHAIINIANNAIMAMSGNGMLLFRLFKKDRYACVEITDTGPGIPHDQREIIFEPLYSSKPKGTGLGLSIARMMIENQDGKIEFTSEIGIGTTFTIFLPMERGKRAQEHGK